jgi:hypothetical protein
MEEVVISKKCWVVFNNPGYELKFIASDGVDTSVPYPDLHIIKRGLEYYVIFSKNINELTGNPPLSYYNIIDKFIDNIVILTTDRTYPMEMWLDKDKLEKLHETYSVLTLFSLQKIINACKYNLEPSKETDKIQTLVYSDKNYYVIGKAGDVNVGDEVLTCVPIYPIERQHELLNVHWKVTSFFNDLPTPRVNLKSKDGNIDYVDKDNCYKIYASTYKPEGRLNKTKLNDIIVSLNLDVDNNLRGKIYSDQVSETELTQNKILTIDSVQPKESLVFIYNNLLDKVDVCNYHKPSLILLGDEVTTHYLLMSDEAVKTEIKGDYYLVEDRFNPMYQYFIVKRSGSPFYGQICKFLPNYHVYNGTIGASVYEDCTLGASVSQGEGFKGTYLFNPDDVASIIATSKKSISHDGLLYKEKVYKLLHHHGVNENKLGIDSNYIQNPIMLKDIIDNCYENQIESDTNLLPYVVVTIFNEIERKVKIPVYSDGAVSLTNYVSNGTEIRNIDVPEGVISLDVTNSKVIDLILPKSLQHLNCHVTSKLKSLTFHEESVLKTLKITNSPLTELVINNEVENLEIITNNSLKKIHLLKPCNVVDVSGNNLNELVVTEGCIELKANKNKLTKFKVPNSIKKLDLSDNELISLKTGSSVENLSAINNSIMFIQLNDGLKSFNVTNNKLTRLNVPNSCSNVYAKGNDICELHAGKSTVSMYIDSRLTMTTMNRKVFNMLYVKPDKDINLKFFLGK